MGGCLAEADGLVCGDQGLGGLGDDAELAHQAQSIPIDEAFDDLAVREAGNGYPGDRELLPRGRNAVELALMNAAAGPTSHNGFAIGKEIFHVQAKILEGVAIKGDALLLTFGTLAKIGRGSVMVLIRGGDDFIRDLQIALIPKFIKQAADNSFILFRHNGSPYKQCKLPTRVWRAGAGMEPLASWVCRPVRRTGGRALREEIGRNPMGSILLALDAGLDLERNFAGNRDWAFRFETAKPEWTVCFATVQVKDNRKFLLAAGDPDVSLFLLAQLQRFAVDGMAGETENHGRWSEPE
jgi:hypothetical protein